MIYGRIIFIVLISVVFLRVYPLKVGSNTAVSVAGHTTFPAADFPNNEMLGFAAFSSGFTLEDSLTTVSFNSAFPISRDVNINGGTIVFAASNVLFFDNGISLNSTGSFIGNNLRMEFSDTLTYMPPDYTFTMDSLQLLLRDDLELRTPLSIFGDCQIDANFHTITLVGDGSITVYPDSTLLLRNAKIEGLRDFNLKCLDDSANIMLDDATMILSHDYTFSVGAILFDEDVLFTGTNKFIYSSTRGSTIGRQATVFFDNKTTFSYVPTNNARDLLILTDSSSQIHFDGANFHVGVGGIELIKGLLLIGRKCQFSNDGTQASEGITFGDGTEDNFFNINLVHGSQLVLESGFLVWDNP